MEESEILEVQAVSVPDEKENTENLESEINSKPMVEKEITKEREEKSTDNFENKEKDLEAKILNEVMEKLKQKEQKSSKNKLFYDMVSKEQNSEGKKAKVDMLRRIVSNDLTKIAEGLRQGVITAQQGQDLKNLVLKKAFDMYVENGSMQTVDNKTIGLENQKETLPQNAVSEFQKENPNFFKQEGREEVLNYLKNVDIGKEEIKRISTIIEQVEKNAVERYLKQNEYEKNLQKSNESAKEKLKANVQSGGLSDNIQRTFTRKQIGKMSCSEFVKNEKQIMAQLRKGLIR